MKVVLREIGEFFQRNPKFKSVTFWLGVVSILFASAGIEFSDLTSWSLFLQAILTILANPVQVVAVIGGLVAVFNDNSTKGLDVINVRKEGK